MLPPVQKRPDVLVDPPIGTHRIVHCETSRQYFRLGLREAHFYESLDGSRSADELRVANAQGFTPEQVDAMLAWFEKERLLGEESPLSDTPSKPWYVRCWLFVVRPDQFRLDLYNPDKLLNRYRNAIDFLFSRAAIALYLFLLLLPVILYAVHPQWASEAASRMHPLMWWQWPVLYASLLIMNVFHELSHAIACKHFGGKVNKIGLMFLYLSPVLYCDVSDSWRFPNVNHKLVVTLAGIFLQMLLSCIGLALWLFTGYGLLLSFVIFNTVLCVFNFFPFIRLDGYWILVHLLDEPNLRTKGLKAIEEKLRSLFRRAPLSSAQSASPMVMAWGIGHFIAIPCFWALGLYELYHNLSRVSILLALVLSALFGGALLYRIIRSIIVFGQSLYPPRVPETP